MALTSFFLQLLADRVTSQLSSRANLRHTIRRHQVDILSKRTNGVAIVILFSSIARYSNMA